METALLQNTQLVAVTPHELAPAQAQVATWCRSKILALALELREQRANLAEAKRMLWRGQGWTKAISKTKARMIYYAKIKSAIGAGYLIVPNFDVDVIAVRVNRLRTNAVVGETRVTPDILPPGVGRYVDDKYDGQKVQRQYKANGGEMRTVTDFHPTGFDTDIDFPVGLVKPAILDATDRAMALRLFDRLGVVRGSRRSDPIVVGQVIHPDTAKWQRRDNPKCITFFVAWWLDTKDI